MTQHRGVTQERVIPSSISHKTSDSACPVNSLTLHAFRKKGLLRLCYRSVKIIKQKLKKTFQTKKKSQFSVFLSLQHKSSELLKETRIYHIFTENPEIGRLRDQASTNQVSNTNTLKVMSEFIIIEWTLYSIVSILGFPETLSQTCDQLSPRK